MSLQRGDKVRGWSGVTADLAMDDSQSQGTQRRTLFLIIALLIGGFVALRMAESDAPIFASAVLSLGLLVAVYAALCRLGEVYGGGTAKPATSAPARAAAPKPAPAAAKPAPVAPAPAPEPVVAEPVVEAAPEPVAEAEEVNPGVRPEGLDGARDGVPDDLTRIKGVGPKMAELCNSLGFYHFDQIAAWTADEVAWVDQNLEGFKGRVTRDDWVAQAKELATG